MKLNEDVVIYGREVALLPYTAKHVTTRHKWLQEKGNRVDMSANAPTIAEENSTQVKFYEDAEHCIFMVADVDIISDPRKREADALIGEVHLLFLPGRSAELQLMITERSPRRKSLVSETLLLILLFGAQALKVQVFVVKLDENADAATENRVMFAARPDEYSGEAIPSRASSDSGPVGGKLYDKKAATSPVNSPIPERKGSVGDSLKSMAKSFKKIFKKEKTEYLCRLTRHLLKEDEGEHWPAELDFELTEPDRVELLMSAEAVRALQLWVGHAKRIKYSSMGGDGVLRRGINTRIDGQTLSLIPYTSRHVSTVHGWMQNQDMYVGFGVQPPTLEQEAKAQAMMAKDENCNAFIVCSKKRPEDDSCPVVLEGRAQLLLLAPGIAQVHIGLVTPELERRAFMLRECLLLLLHYTRTVLPVSRVTMVAKTAIRPVADPRGLLWNSKLDFAQSPDGKTLAINLDENAVKLALSKLCKGVVIRSFAEDDVIYEQGSSA